MGEGGSCSGIGVELISSSKAAVTPRIWAGVCCGREGGVWGLGRRSCGGLKSVVRVGRFIGDGGNVRMCGCGGINFE